MDLSHLRQNLFERVKAFVREIEGLNLYRKQIRCSLYRHRIRCGYANCHCAKGPGHLRWCIGFSTAKGRHTRTLSQEQVDVLRSQAKSYRQYRHTRAHVALLAREIFFLVDKISRYLQQPLPRRLIKGKAKK